MARSLGRKVHMRCADGYREGTKSIRRCVYRKQLDLDTLVCTRGPNFPLSRLGPRAYSDHIFASFVSNPSGMAQKNIEPILRTDASLPHRVLLVPQVANRKPSPRRRVIVEKRFPPAVKGSEPLCRIVPMHHGFERMLSFTRMNTRVDFGPAVLPHLGDDQMPLRREARDLEALFRIERAAPVEIAERLVAEEPVRGQNRPAAVGQSIQLGAVNPQAGQRPLARFVFERNARRAGLELGRAGRDRLLEPRRPALPLPEPKERAAKIVLGHRPVERNPLARHLLQRRTIGRDRLLEPRRYSTKVVGNLTYRKPIARLGG